MIDNVRFDLDLLKKDLSKNQVSEMIVTKSKLLNKKNLIFSTSNNYMQSRNNVLKMLERNMFHQEMKLMATILIESYGMSYMGHSYYYERQLETIIKDKGRYLCLISSHGLHLTLSSLNE